MAISRRIASLVLGMSLSAGGLAQELYTQLLFGDPALAAGGFRSGWSGTRVEAPSIGLDGPGEAYFVYAEMREGSGWFADVEPTGIVIRTPDRRATSGLLRHRGFLTSSFRIAEDKLGNATREDFLRAKHRHYSHLQELGLPGAAWFRHQVRACADELGAPGAQAPRNGWLRTARRSDPSDEYDLFSGGRAVSENLQFDRVITPVPGGAPTKLLSEVPGITVKAFDWTELVKGLSPARDPLAECVPEDQHAAFFPNVAAMAALLEVANRQGTPVIQGLEQRAEDARTLERYQAQLGLPLAELAAALGAEHDGPVVITGGDAELRLGSDVAVLFETAEPQRIADFVASRHKAAVDAGGAMPATGTALGIAYSGARSPDGTLRSFVARIPHGLVVANSLAQLERVLAASQKKTPRLADSPEYLFFRDRYPREARDKAEGFLLLTDATIRRWCGPLWRIGSARRVRAAAVLGELQSARIDKIVSQDPTDDLPQWPESAGHGTISWSGSGPVSSDYGSLDFLTPIGELDLERATSAEVEAYGLFRDLYQKSWRRFFDPIALRLAATPLSLEADVTVLPLNATTDYQWLLDLTRSKHFGARSGFPHGALIQVAFAVDAAARGLDGFRDASSVLEKTVTAAALSWLGNGFGVFLDRDAALEASLKSEDGWDFEIEDLPIGLWAEVKEPVALASLLAGIRATIDEVAEGLTKWDKAEHAGVPYTVISASVPYLGKMAIHYAALPEILIVTLRKDVLERAIDRVVARRKGAPEPTGAGADWLGSSAALRIGPELLDALRLRKYSAHDEQQLAWSNLPILNEWKRLFPDEDPVAVHERLFKTRLVGPRGEAYVWNETAKTMASSVFGHPDGAFDPPGPPPWLAAVRAADFGLTFEHDGVRARVRIDLRSK